MSTERFERDLREASDRMTRANASPELRARIAEALAAPPTVRRASCWRRPLAAGLVAAVLLVAAVGGGMALRSLPGVTAQATPAASSAAPSNGSPSPVGSLPSASAAPASTTPSQPAATPSTTSGSDGVAWNRLPRIGLFRSFALVTPSVVVLATDIDLRISEDGGRTWRVATPPGRFVEGVYWAFAFGADGSGLAIGCPQTCDHLAYWRTADLGRTWTPSNALAGAPGFSEWSVGLEMLDDGQLVLAASDGSHRAASLYISSDRGATWDGPRMAPRFLAGVAQAVALDNGTSAGLVTLPDAAAAAPAVSVSTDGGLTWNGATLPPPAGAKKTAGPSRMAGARMFDASSGWFALTWGSDAGGLHYYRTADGGGTWISADTPARPRLAADVASASSPGSWWELASTIIADGGGTTSGVIQSVRTTDAGATWTTTNAALPGWKPNGTGLSGGSESWATSGDTTALAGLGLPCASACSPKLGDQQDVLFLTTDGGVTWRAITPVP